MRNNLDHIRDIAEIRSMMERSSKFMSLSGWAGIFAGTYALIGALIATKVYHFHPVTISDATINSSSAELVQLIILALVVLLMASGTAIFFSYQRAKQRGEKAWNATARRLLSNMAVPLFTGVVILIFLLTNGLLGLLAPFTLIFYGLALYNAGTFTFKEVKILGLVQLSLGLISIWLISYAIILWAVGFGLAHIIYGIYMHNKYER
ncbi:hypothetical protein SAMN04488057_105117 [Cyclobacterium lianum]|uniref:Uncharacterized protein n=1 Tax=Cyclobacterium lianum TaxID=388280 RepID=A0A1M7N7P3_9BACT|nr:hypothetical protein [Cyclobacterium lianum]SHM99628.1 hypothetical protein SAMN04488057_105117 [Cyclobacterium lianum]